MGARANGTHVLARLALAPLLLCYLVVAPVQAQEAPGWDVFRAAAQGGGPADDGITSLVLDAGTVWVGTPRGLSRYDGSVWDSWLTGDSELDDVRALLVDASGYLWIGTAGGVLRLDPARRWADRRLLSADLTDVNALSPAADGGVWIGTLRGATYWPAAEAPETGRRVHLLPEENVLSVREGERGEVWLGTESGRVIRYPADGALQTFSRAHGLPGTRVYALWVDGRAGVWVGTLSGACRLSSADPEPTCEPLEPLRDLVVTGFYPGADGSVWAATTAGAVHLNDRRVLETIQPTLETALRRDEVRAVAQDAEGQLWLATSGGLARRRAPVWEPLLPVSEGTRLLERDVRAIAVDAAGDLWAGTARGLRRQNSAGDWDGVAALAEAAVDCLWADGGDELWLCADGQVARLVRGEDLERPVDDAGPWAAGASTLRRGPEGAVWLLTDVGAVWRWEGEGDWREGANWGLVLEGGARGLAFDPADNLWVSAVSGLRRFDGQNWQTWRWDDLLSRTGCVATGNALSDARDEVLIWEGPERLWVGTRVGLLLFQDGQTRCWDRRRGLVGDHVRALGLEASGERRTLWVGTFEGMSRADLSAAPEEDLPLVTFAGESLPHDFVQAVHVDPGRGVLLGTPNGLWAFQPSTAAPQVRLRRTLAGRVDHDTLLQPRQPLELAHDAPVALFAWGGDLRTPQEALIYRYQVDAGDRQRDRWSMDRTVPLTDLLPPGDAVTVTARAFDRDFNPSSDVAQLRLIRRAVPLLNQPWFLALIGLLLVGGTFGLSRAARFWRLYGYHDLALTLAPADSGEAFVVRLTARRRLAYWLLGPLREEGFLFQRLLGRERGIRAFPFLGVVGRYERRLDRAALERPLEQLRDDRIDEASLRALGQRLYEGLFTADATAALRRHLSLGRAGVRVRLRFDSGLPGLAALPWEYLHGGGEPGFLSVASDVTLVRDLTPPEREKVARARRPLKVLLAWAMPREDRLPRLDVSDEIGAIQEAFAPLVDRERAVVQVLPNASIKTFRQEVQKGCDLIHFTGHGGVEGGEGVLYFEDEDGYAVPLYQTALATLLAEAPTVTDKTPKLILLNACRTADPDTVRGVGGLAAALVQKGKLPAAVGMGYPIATGSAATFAQAFYGALAPYGQVDHAVAKGREALSVELGMEMRDWGVPRLYTRQPGGVIFDRV